MKYIIPLSVALTLLSGAAMAAPPVNVVNLPATVSTNAGTVDASTVRTVAGEYTPAAGTASSIVTGGTAVTVVTGPVNGGYICNPLNTAAQGVTAENAYVDQVGTPGSTDGAANGTTALLVAGQCLTLPPTKTGSVVKANAATSGHKLSVVVW